MPYQVIFNTESSQARTLGPESICRDYRSKDANHSYSLTHDSGWTITGTLKEDYYFWVNEFVATHQWYGTVQGDFEDRVEATSKEAYNHFVSHHPYEEWDYWDR